MSRPVPSLPVAGTDSPPVATITRSTLKIALDVVSANRAVRCAVRSVTVVSNRISTPFDRANATSASRTSFDLFDRGNSFAGFFFERERDLQSRLRRTRAARAAATRAACRAAGASASR